MLRRLGRCAILAEGSAGCVIPGLWNRGMTNRWAVCYALAVRYNLCCWTIDSLVATSFVDRVQELCEKDLHIAV